MALTIRQAALVDEAALSHICLVTADAGKSADPLHDHKELPGLVYAVPYLHLPTTWAFVLVDNENVVGYIVGSKDTRVFEQRAAEEWWPIHAEKYPPTEMVKEADKRYAKLLRNMDIAPEAHVAFSPAHLHINIVEEHQGKGWGRKLIETAVNHLKTEGVDGVWLGMDPRNSEARKFYQRVGFSTFEGASPHAVGMRFK
ncbi:N-acetyltransferase domain-containing protein [Mycena indigotica]|uniref:N-acetyltransferase domain-containing protein n=1 Tax=Mycena indigotica TaxID=2126181 RepID=A0A8H6SPV7_9AGAR|nr:N-acetyltransferase domain-containing protein [Mycena indigotica]KAF7301795.1 N-acetyltransferase domain-containing protein [Mycena indigotica]